MTRLALLIAAVLLFAACEPEVGAKAWCEMMEEKPKGDWTFDAATDYANHRILK